MRQVILAMTLSLAIGGCAASTTQSSFNCGVNQTEDCFTIGQADARGLNKQAGVSGDIETDDKPRPPGSALAELRLAGGDSSQARTREVVIELWVGPFVDEANNLHQPSTINVIVWQAEWNLERAR